MNRPTVFKKGNKLATGGARPGAGRPSDWLVNRCRNIVKRNKLVEFLSKVATGKDIDQAINPNGECLKIPASVKNRLRAVEYLVDRGFGKQHDRGDRYEINLQFVEILVVKFNELIQRFVPTKCPHCQGALHIRKDLAEGLETIPDVVEIEAPKMGGS